MNRLKPSKSNLRSDAATNRERLLDAADSVFSELGVDAPLDLIAARADVSRTTFFRRFPDRAAVLAALLDRSLDELEAEAKRIGPAPDALFRLLEFLLARVSFRANLVDHWYPLDVATKERKRAEERIASIFEGPIRRSIKVGLCRSDLALDDIGLFAAMLSGALRGRTLKERQRVADRVARLLLEGFRSKALTAKK